MIEDRSMSLPMEMVRLTLRFTEHLINIHLFGFELLLIQIDVLPDERNCNCFSEYFENILSV